MSALMVVGVPISGAGCRSRIIQTVCGPISADSLGSVLSHEHVLVDFIGAAQATPDRYEIDEVFAVVLPHLIEAKQAGCDAMFEFTPAYLGRDPVLLKRLSEASGLHLITNTGYYGAREDQHVPAFAFDATADELAQRWILEAQEGIAGTGIRPGFIKIGVDPGPLSSIDRKLVHAAAITHRATGLIIATHTGPAAAAFEQLEVLQEEGVQPSAWIWVHAQSEPDESRLVEAARRGAWVAFDGISPDSAQRHVKLVQVMHGENLLHRVLLSQDAGWYRPGEPGGGAYRGYAFFYRHFLPALREAGLTGGDIHRLIVSNPADAYSVRRRVI